MATFNEQIKTSLDKLLSKLPLTFFFLDPQVFIDNINVLLDDVTPFRFLQTLEEGSFLSLALCLCMAKDC